MKKVYLLVILCLMGFAGYSQTPVFRTSTVYAGSSPFQDSMWTFQSTDYSVVRRLAPTVAGHTITGITGIAKDPTTGISYAILKETGVTNRVLATINVQTGVCTEIGNLGDKFASLAFNANGSLFGATGNGATVPETMFKIDKATAATTLFRTLGSGSDGEVIAFCPDNNKFYHWSGGGVVWERFDTTGTDVIETLTYTGTTGGETFGALYIGGGKFLVSDIGSNFRLWDTSGVIGSDLSDNPDDIRGLVAESHTSSITPSIFPTVCAGTPITFTVSGGTGDYQWYLDGAQISGETNATYTTTVAGHYNSVYTDSNGIADSTAAGIDFIVNPLPAAITGADQVCIGSMITVSDATTGGEWSSSTPSVATVGSLSGDINGVSVGSATISYILTATGCYTTLPVTVNPLPVVSGGSAVTICSGSSTGLTGTGADVYSWSPADGLSCTGCANPVASPTATTTYTLTGTKLFTGSTVVYSESFINSVTPTTQCTAWDVFRSSLTGTYVGFTIRGSMNSTGITCTDPVVAAAVANAMLTGTSYSGSSDGQTWTVGIGCTSGPCGSVAVELSNMGNCACGTGYSVRPSINNDNWGGIDGPICGAASQTMEVLFYTGAPSGCSNTATVTVSVNPLPAVYNVTGGGSYCAGGAGVSIGVDTSNGSVKYQVYDGLTAVGSPVAGTEDSLDLGLQTMATTYTVVGTDSITGCSSMMNGSATVTITPLSFPSISIFRSTSDTICAGTHTTFTTSITDGGSTPHYIWKVNGAVSGTDSVAYDYVPTDGNMVSVSLVSSEACPSPNDTVSSDTLYMVVFPNGTPTVTLSVTANDTVCAGATVTVNATPAFGGYGPTYTFVKNTVVVGTSSSYTYVPIDGDNLYAIMESNYMCRLATTAYSNVIDMTVEAPIVPSVTIAGRPGVTILPHMADTLTATVTNGGSAPSYQWYLNGVPVAGATSSVFTRSEFADRDSVSCMVTRNDACHLSTINSIVLRVYPVGVKTFVANSSVVLVPNPNKGTFSVKGSLGLATDQEGSLEITNMLGQNVYSSKFTAVKGMVNEQVQMSSALASGIYMLTMHTANGNQVFRFVVD